MTKAEIEQHLAATHREYKAMRVTWQKCRDFLAGEDALREHDISGWYDRLATTVTSPEGKSSRQPARDGFIERCLSSYILPLSPKMLYSEYVLYVLRGHYYPVVAPSKASYIGQIFAKPPRCVLPADALADMDDADLKGTPLELLVKNICDEVLSVGRVGMLVDHPEIALGVTMSQAERSRSGLRPYFALYRAEDILDWDEGRVGTRYQPVYYKLREEVKRGDGYDYDYRELKLDATRGYYQVVWTRETAKSEYTAREVFPRDAHGQPFGYIPFRVFSPRGLGMSVERPPLLDLITLAHEYYQANVEYANARFAAGSPTPVFLGFDDNEVEGIVLGGLNGIHATNADADAKYLEFTGSGLEPLKTALDGIESRLAKLGSRILMQDKAAAEAAETLKIRASGEEANLADISDSISRIMAISLGDLVKMGYADGAVEFALNKEFSTTSADPQELEALRKAIADNIYSINDYLRRIRKMGLLDDDRSDEEIVADLESSAERKQAQTDAQIAARMTQA